MAINYVTVTWDMTTVAQGSGLPSTVTFTPTATLAITSTGQTIPPVPIPYAFATASGTSTPLIATDNSGITPATWFYNITIQVPGQPAQTFTNVSIAFANGATQTLASLGI